jgi:hypothetical protein
MKNSEVYRPLVSFDHELVISELTQAGVLFVDTENRARIITESTDRHTNIGLLDFRQSSYLTNWLGIRGLTPNRMGAFVSSPILEPTVWHRDGPQTMCAINIPWFGTKNTYTEWCTGVDLHETTVIRPGTTEVQRVEGHGFGEPTERTELHNKAIAMDTVAFHRVVPEEGSCFRGILSLRFENGYTYRQLSDHLERIENP